jgi:hypothetical protein
MYDPKPVAEVTTAALICPLEDHVLVLLLLLMLAWMTVGVRGGEHAEQDQGDVGAALAA